MTSTLSFDEKKFWIVLFSIVARREAAREQAVERAAETQKQQERRDWRMRTGRRAQEKVGRVAPRPSKGTT